MPLRQILDADLLVGTEEHGRSGLGTVPFLPGLRANRAHLVERQLALVDELERHVRRHHLRHRRRRHPDVGILRIKDGTRRKVDQIGDLRGRIELGSRRGRRGGDKDGSGGDSQGKAAHEGDRNPT